MLGLPVQQEPRDSTVGNLMGAVSKRSFETQIKNHWEHILFHRYKSVLFNLLRNSSICLLFWLKPEESGRVTEDSPVLINKK